MLETKTTKFYTEGNVDYAPGVQFSHVVFESVTPQGKYEIELRPEEKPEEVILNNKVTVDDPELLFDVKTVLFRIGHANRAATKLAEMLKQDEHTRRI